MWAQGLLAELQVRDASLPSVGKLAGFSVPSPANEARKLALSLVTNAEPRNPETAAAKADARSRTRLGAQRAAGRRISRAHLAPPC